MLACDRTPYGQAFTWLSTHSLDWLERRLLWRPAKSGHLALDPKAIRRMTVQEAVTVRRWIESNQQEEARQIQEAYKRGRQGT